MHEWMEMQMLYEILKAVHIVAVVLWFGGMIAMALALVAGNQPFLAGFRRWDMQVTAPAMGLAWVLGITIAVLGGWFSEGWLHAKLLFVLVASGLHGVLSGRLRRATDGAAIQSLPVAMPAIIVSLCVIVTLVVLKPF